MKQINLKLSCTEGDVENRYQGEQVRGRTKNKGDKNKGEQGGFEHINFLLSNDA